MEEGRAGSIGQQSTWPEMTKYASCASVVVVMSTSSTSVDHWLRFYDVFFQNKSVISEVLVPPRFAGVSIE